MAVRDVPRASAPERFLRALESIRAARLRPEVVLTEVPAPGRIAPHAAALTADVMQGGEEAATGRFVLLHDPAGQAAWEGVFRVVTFVRAALEPELGSDPLLGQVGWSWVIDSLQGTGAQAVASGGTVTRVVSESFAGLADRSPTVEIEIRASWTPHDDDLAAHVRAWADLLCIAAGLPPLPDGVSTLPRRLP